jgi:hypothetical protein
MDTSVTNGVMKMFWSDGTISTYTPPAGPTVDLSNYYTKAEADSRFLSKAQADLLYAPLGAGGGGSHGYMEYMAGTYSFTPSTSGVFVTASGGGGGGAMDGMLGLAGTDVAAGGRAHYCYRAFLSVTPGQSYQIIVGAAGANNRAPLNGDGRGTAGGPTSFGSLLTLQGGGGGFAPYYGSGTDGASGWSATLQIGSDPWDNVQSNRFGYGGSFVLLGFDGTSETNPGRGFMIIEW